MSEYMVEIIDVVKSFGSHNAVNNVSFNVKKGEFLTLLGPSGCGKTTTLRMIAGFEQLTSGEIKIDGKDVGRLAPYERDVNTVFQSYALFPHMTVSDNIAFGLKMKKKKKGEIQEEVERALKLVQLEGFAKRKPDQLSGGQKQRVAIARALVNNPKVLLLDEPLGALDLQLRKQMQIELKHLQQRLGITFIYVTHDQEEALTMSDRIAIMNGGNLEQIGGASDVYEKPRTKFVAGFIGETNLFTGKVLAVDSNQALADIEGSRIPIKAANGLKPQDEIILTVRPERAWLEKQPSEGTPHLQGEFVEKIYIGSVVKSVLKLASGRQVTISESPSKVTELAVGETAYVYWDLGKAEVLTK
ncbi:ABC transporter ATP-binding protein [Paenibacillaceae bacterium T2]|uniref:Spermidine/putrescine import ATP-binding protein PotA n=1 Tax=Ferviditalea candida TaxID=3108399 RepID=A0ABU5ZEB5_9BACL|nr:ABC transporter ATP-binding protein [Paenibacillaceae bacterium T2]